MKNILLIGVGKLGVRHLQAIQKINIPAKIQVVDNSIDSLQLAKEISDSSEKSSTIKTITFLRNISDVEGEIDVCIIATSANVRLNIMKELLSLTKVNNFLLEKVLFQSLTQLHEAINLLKSKGAKAWVNCPRRMYDFYKDLKVVLDGDEFVSLKVCGSEWGMACNSIHFIDLWAFLSKDAKYNLKCTKLEPVIYESKRPGFMEVYGILTGSSKNSYFELICTHADKVSLEIEIETNNHHVLINEVFSNMRVTDKRNDSFVDEKISIPFQSNLTNIFCENLLSQQEPELVCFSESACLHEAYLESLLQFFKNIDLKFKECPIT
ncbi:Gfo/Idh/MocA family oxidoreductase [Serratia fonticola]|uniref:Gfo/Idh/MocA family oxidoreductase n=1 Tax=Serratia fonticola TaxID=47917 RepID=UPI00164546AC|nr:Gfo/Idh/MocA family oxidoreductase [Serratia fonticola]MBC3229579.1 Gfo/Idh/MocA family oxidoreductase [Serratia fonticola]